jgi:hypothetical protein
MPDVIDSGFRVQNPPINIRAKEHSRAEIALMLDLLIALPLRSRSIPLISPKEPARCHIRD